MKRPIRTASTFVLDHDPKCQCGNFATTFMEVHHVDDCMVDATVASFICNACLRKNLESISRVCELGGDVCVTCGLEIVTPSDLIVRMTSLA